MINVQHDCSAGKCPTTKTGIIQQERQETSRRRAVVTHSATPDFVINMHALHNQQLLRSALPASLREPPVLFNDREQTRVDAVSNLHAQKALKAAAKDAAALKLLDGKVTIAKAKQTPAAAASAAPTTAQNSRGIPAAPQILASEFAAAPNPLAGTIGFEGTVSALMVTTSAVTDPPLCC